jgi:GT2 family glycosyltransferase
VQTTATDAPRVLAVLVAHDGAPWLPETLAALEGQTHAALELIAVDNASTDGSRELLLDRLGPERVLVADRDLGFGAAVSMALDARVGHDADYVLLVHDDLALAPDAVAQLVAALEADPRLAIVGPKLRRWGASRELQSVGWTIDITGRADSGVDEGELDQGQRDQERRSLYVSTAGMLVRRQVFDDLGRFDRRFHVFRDDLDLCWRAWSSGHEVEVQPDAVGDHVAAATDYVRLGQTRFIGPRYFAERNTLAALLKNYGAARLFLVIPLYLVVGIAKVAGFLLTRRVSDAWQTVRAWVWNVVHLRETRRLRREVQARRTRTDRELGELFGRLAPRARAYLEAIASWIAGGDIEEAPAPPDDGRPPPEPESATHRLRAFARRRPVALAGLLLAMVVLIGALPLLEPGELRGGELAPWPASSAAFLSDHVAGWHEAGAFGTSLTPSPSQGLLGVLQFVVGGSAYLAPRLLLLGTIAAGWVLALRAAQLYSRRKLPRAVAATAYILSPPVLAALSTGRVGSLVVVAVVPGLVAAASVMGHPRTPADRSWRAVAGAVLLAAVGIAFEPLLALVVVVAGLLAGAAVLFGASDGAWQRAVLARTAVSVIAPFVLLGPWSLELLRGEVLVGPPVGATVGGELWRWVALAPDLAGFPGLLAGIGFVLAGLLGLVLGAPRRPVLVLGLWAAALIGATGAWWLDREAVGAWAGAPLVITAGAYAGLFALAFATAEAQLTRYGFGWRQLAALATSVAVAVSVTSVAWTLVRGPWDAYAIDEPSLPSFVTTAAVEDEDLPFRVLVLADDGEQVRWDIVPGPGPTMAAYGVPVDPAARSLAEAAIEDLLTGRDARAADRLGALNVRYVVVPAAGVSDELDATLRSQLSLQARPVASGRVLTVDGWFPRAIVVPAGPDEAAVERDELTPDTAFDLLRPLEQGAYRGTVTAPGTLMLAEVSDGGWEVAVGDIRLTPQRGDLVRVADVPPGPSVTISHAGDIPRSLAITGQLIALLLVVSLALRPPRFARRVGRPASDPADPATVVPPPGQLSPPPGQPSPSAAPAGTDGEDEEGER